MRAKQQQHRSPSSTPSASSSSVIGQSLVAAPLQFTSHGHNHVSPPPLPLPSQHHRTLPQDTDASDQSMDSTSLNGLAQADDYPSTGTSANSSPLPVTAPVKPTPGGWMFPRFEAVAPAVSDASHAPSTAPQPQPTPPSEDRVNRRKKARPQRAYESIAVEHADSDNNSPVEEKCSSGVKNEPDSIVPLLTSS